MAKQIYTNFHTFWAISRMSLDEIGTPFFAGLLAAAGAAFEAVCFLSVFLSDFLVDAFEPLSAAMTNSRGMDCEEKWEGRWDG